MAPKREGLSIGGNVDGNVADHGSSNGDYYNAEAKVLTQNAQGDNIHFAQQQVKDCEGSGNGGEGVAAQTVCCKSHGVVCCASSAFSEGSVSTKSSSCPESHPFSKDVNGNGDDRLLQDGGGAAR